MPLQCTCKSIKRSLVAVTLTILSFASYPAHSGWFEDPCEDHRFDNFPSAKYSDANSNVVVSAPGNWNFTDLSEGKFTELKFKLRGKCKTTIYIRSRKLSIFEFISDHDALLEAMREQTVTHLVDEGHRITDPKQSTSSTTIPRVFSVEFSYKKGKNILVSIGGLTSDRNLSILITTSSKRYDETLSSIIDELLNSIELKKTSHSTTTNKISRTEMRI